MMATKRKPLRLVDSEYRPRRNARRFNNGMQPPCKLTAPQQHAWNTVIRRLPWLCETDLPLAVQWCRLWVTFVAEKNPTAAQYQRLLRLGSQLGLSPLARARLSVDNRRAQLRALPARSPATRYFEPDGAA